MFVSKYNSEDKKRWIEEFKSSGKAAQTYAKEIGVPATTFRMWLKQEANKQYEKTFGTIAIGENEITDNTINDNNVNSIKYCGKKIKIVLESGYDKEFLKKVIEVLINDK